ncbi:hypothetical protein HDU67_000377 [Dinochytrium kinnereticum]|nr:hypothetical protein HDU67_000377 [Dinochytrium kinnereticum]
MSPLSPAAPSAPLSCSFATPASTATPTSSCAPPSPSPSPPSPSSAIVIKGSDPATSDFYLAEVRKLMRTTQAMSKADRKDCILELAAACFERPCGWSVVVEAVEVAAALVGLDKEGRVAALRTGIAIKDTATSHQETHFNSNASHNHLTHDISFPSSPASTSLSIATTASTSSIASPNLLGKRTREGNHSGPSLAYYTPCEYAIKNTAHEAIKPCPSPNLMLTSAEMKRMRMIGCFDGYAAGEAIGVACAAEKDETMNRIPDTPSTISESLEVDPNWDAWHIVPPRQKRGEEVMKGEERDTYLGSWKAVYASRLNLVSGRSLFLTVQDDSIAKGTNDGPVFPENTNAEPDLPKDYAAGDRQRRNLFAWPEDPNDAYLVCLDGNILCWVDSEDRTVINIARLSTSLGSLSVTEEDLTGEPIMRPAACLRGHTRSIGLVLSNSGGLLASFDEASNILVWELGKDDSQSGDQKTAEPSGRLIRRINATGDLGFVYSMNIHGTQIITGSRTGRVVIFDALTGDKLHDLGVPLPYVRVLNERTLVNVAVWGRWAAYGLFDGRFFVFDVIEKRYVWSFEARRSKGMRVLKDFGWVGEDLAWEENADEEEDQEAEEEEVDHEEEDLEEDGISMSHMSPVGNTQESISELPYYSEDDVQAEIPWNLDAYTQNVEHEDAMDISSISSTSHQDATFYPAVVDPWKDEDKDDESPRPRSVSPLGRIERALAVFGTSSDASPRRSSALSSWLPHPLPTNTTSVAATVASLMYRPDGLGLADLSWEEEAGLHEEEEEEEEEEEFRTPVEEMAGCLVEDHQERDEGAEKREEDFREKVSSLIRLFNGSPSLESSSSTLDSPMSTTRDVAFTNANGIPPTDSTTEEDKGEITLTDGEEEDTVAVSDENDNQQDYEPTPPQPMHQENEEGEEADEESGVLFPYPDGPFAALAPMTLALNGNILLTNGVTSDTLSLWDLTSGKLLHTLSCRRGEGGETWDIPFAEVSSDGTMVYGGVGGEPFITTLPAAIAEEEGLGAGDAGMGVGGVGQDPGGLNEEDEVVDLTNEETEGGAHVGGEVQGGEQQAHDGKLVVWDFRAGGGETRERRFEKVVLEGEIVVWVCYEGV